MVIGLGIIGFCFFIGAVVFVCIIAAEYEDVNDTEEYDIYD